MATSGTTTFNPDLSEIFEEAYGRCGRNIRTGDDASRAKRSLNLLLAEWSNRGLNLWTVEQGTITTTSGQGSETLPVAMADILTVVLRRDGTDYQVERISRQEYDRLPDKDQTGRPSQFWFDRQLTPVLYLWPVPENSTDQVLYRYQRRIEDAGALQNTTDIPWRFYPCLVSGLAYQLALTIAPDRVQMLKSLYEEEFSRAADEDEERTSLLLVPDHRYLRV